MVFYFGLLEKLNNCNRFSFTSFTINEKDRPQSNYPSSFSKFNEKSKTMMVMPRPRQDPNFKRTLMVPI